jgi:hypothetical protein
MATAAPAQPKIRRWYLMWAYGDLLKLEAEMEAAMAAAPSKDSDEYLDAKRVARRVDVELGIRGLR